MSVPEKIDLSNCDREQVQFPGAIQPHGCMLVVEEPSLKILQASANTRALLGIDHDKLLGASLERAVGKVAAVVASRLAAEPLDNGPAHIVCLGGDETAAGEALNLFAHRCQGATILELETVPKAAQAPWPRFDLYKSLSRLRAAETLQAFLDLAVAEIQQLTGFQRVMAYRFDEDGSGEVIAEALDGGFAPYLGLHFPASDIPAPARRLFAMSWLRHLPNVDYIPVPIAPQLSPVTGAPLDQSYAMLRSLSTMYTGYLKNMGVKATMVAPLMKDGALWGLVSAMHHSEPRHVPHEVRRIAEFLTQMLSPIMAAKEDADNFAHRLTMKAALDRTTQALAAHPDLHAALTGAEGRAGLDAYIDAGGAAVVTSDRVTPIGATPGEIAIRHLAEWLSSRPDLVFATDRLGEVCASARELRDTAAGLLAIRLSRGKPEYAMWFRPERARIVNWAGDPDKPVEMDFADGAQRLRPRASFALWRQEVRGRAKRWADFEIKAAVDLRWALIEALFLRTEEIEQLNRELQEANDRQRRAEEVLREADRRKDQFLATLAHELRNPLGPLSNGIHILKKIADAAPTDRRRELLDMMERQADQLVRIVDDLLDISRISLGKIELRKERTDIATILRNALETCQLLMERKGHRVTLHVPSEALAMDGDRMRLGQVFVNLINNAAKFTAPGGRIEIEAEREGDVAVVRVRDNGAGLAPEDLPQVFRLFAQVSERAFSPESGLGIGLALARSLIELHGGRIEAQSEGLGRGSEFSVRLPLDRSAGRAPASDIAERGAAWNAKRAVVIDDNHDVADSFGLLLESLGAVVRVAYDGAAGVEMVSSFDPDLVFVDIGMPQVDGFETARRILSSPLRRRPTLIALTGFGQEEDRVKTRRAGFDAHLVKPATIEALEAFLR
jgi:two-component system, chemotaxis family, sensor kinase Cph1